MRNEITVRLTYKATNITPNVDKVGLKTLTDPIFGRKYGYGSAANVKHCLKETFAENLGILPMKKVFIKKLKVEKGKAVKSTDGEQSGVSTKIDVNNPSIVFGVWDNLPNNDNTNKLDAKLKSAVRISEFGPLHSLLTKTTNWSSNSKDAAGVNHGSAYDEVAAEYSKNNDKVILFNADEISNKTGLSVEDAQEWINCQRKVNLYIPSNVISGIYKTDFIIEIDRLYTFNHDELIGIVGNEQNIDKLISDYGWVKETDNLGIVKYHPSVEVMKETFKGLVEALFAWDFQSNNSLNGSVKELIRIDIACNNTHKWQCATMGVVENTDEDIPKATLTIRNNIDGVYSYSTPLLDQVLYVCADGEAETSLDAVDQAKSKLLEIGETFIK